MHDAAGNFARNGSGCGWDKGPALDLDENGYPRSIASGAQADLIFGSPPHVVPGDHYIYFEGQGRIEGILGASGTVIASGQTIVADPSRGYITLSIKQTNPADHIRNIRIIPAAMLERYQAGEIFWPALKQNWSMYCTLRFMDWGHTNNSPNSRWADRASVDDYSYGSDRGVPYVLPQAALPDHTLRAIQYRYSIPSSNGKLFTGTIGKLFSGNHRIKVR